MLLALVVLGVATERLRLFEELLRHLVEVVVVRSTLMDSLEELVVGVTVQVTSPPLLVQTIQVQVGEEVTVQTLEETVELV